MAGVRQATRADAGDITNLLRDAYFGHLHVDWRYPIDWLGSPGFVLLEAPREARQARSLTGRLFGERPSIAACLAVTPDPPPAAWVRVAAIARGLSDPPAVLASMFGWVVAHLRETAVTQVAWMPIDSWPEAWLQDLGFTQISAIETYVKECLDLPPTREVPNLHLRGVRASDYDRLAEIEAAAFDPIWRHSAEALALAQRQSFSFDVAERDGRILGFQFSTRSRSGAHLARMTVDPIAQRSGIGGALLARAINSYRAHGLRSVSLNTQIDNLPSQRLYTRFGFHPTGERFPVWAVNL